MLIFRPHLSFCLVTFALLGYLNSARAALYTYCLENEQDCDEAWTPFPNMGAALVGYDLPKGNPFATNSIEDPGLRKQIFNATWEDEGDYVLESGISAREYHMCDKEFKTRLATNMKGYETIYSKSSLTGFGFDLGIEAEEDGGRHEGHLPPMVTVAWQKTDEYENVRQFIFRTRGAIAVAEAQCITHKVDVSHFLTPGFHPSFIEVLRFLEKQNSQVKQKRAFKRFIRDYGTHYISSAYMGAKVAVAVFYNNYERLKFGRQRIANCTSELARRSFGLQPEETDSDDDKDDEDENGLLDDGSQLEQRCPEVDSTDPERMLVTTYGESPDPEEEFSNWEEQEFDPIPIKFELTPIVNAFTVENLDERHNISSTKILDWFLPLYLRYCKEFGFDCSAEAGCGFNDNCKFDENCVRDRKTKQGYRCQATSWADVPNWPQMPDRPQNRQTSANRRSDEDTSVSVKEPESPNISWFFQKDLDQSGSLSVSELWIKYAENTWYNQRYQTAIDKLIYEADLDRDHSIDLNEFIKLHEKHPWYAEQLTFMLMNTDNNKHLSRQELIEAAAISPDMAQLSFGQNQLEHLVDGLLAVGDRNKDNKISFEEYVYMTRDVFVDNFAPNVFKRVLRG